MVRMETKVLDPTFEMVEHGMEMSDQLIQDIQINYQKVKGYFLLLYVLGCL